MPTLNDLPTEIVKYIGDLLDRGDKTDRPRLAMVSDMLRIKTRESHANPTLSNDDWIRFNDRFERDALHRPNVLACRMCHQHLLPNQYVDNQARKTQRRARFCFTCGEHAGMYKWRTFLMGGIKMFACGGCHVAIPISQEDVCLEDEVRTLVQHLGRQLRATDTNVSPAIMAAAMTKPNGVPRSRRHWCSPCWTARVLAFP